EGAYTYVEMFPDTMTGLAIGAGRHILALVDADDHVALTTALIEVKGGMTTEVVVSGDTSSLRGRSMLDDPSAVPAGSQRLRLMNALDDHQPIELVQCANGLDGACVSLAGPVSYGDVTEMDAPDAVVPELAWRLASPDAVNPVANTLVSRS